MRKVAIAILLVVMGTLFLAGTAMAENGTRLPGGGTTMRTMENGTRLPCC